MYVGCNDPPLEDDAHAALERRNQALEGEGWEPDDYPIPGYLSPPLLRQPAYVCTDTATVSGAVENAQITIIDSGGSVLGNGVADTEGWATVNLNRNLVQGDVLRAYQTFNGIQSDDSSSVMARTFEGKLPRPEILHDVWACGGRLASEGAENHIPIRMRLDGQPDTGSTAHQIFDNIPTDFNGEFHPPRISGVNVGDIGEPVEIFQNYCEQDPNLAKSGPLSNTKIVQQPPKTLRPLTHLQAEAGTSKLELENTHVGEYMEISHNGSGIGNGFAIDKPKWWWPFGTDVQFTDSSQIEVERSLCQTSTVEQATVIPQQDVQNSLSGPKFDNPICENARYVRIRPQQGGGRLILERKAQGGSFKYIAQTTASGGGFTTLGLPNSVQLKQGDELRVRQIWPSGLESPTRSAQVTGGSSLKVQGALPFFDQNTGSLVTGFLVEGNGPTFELGVCCTNFQNNAPASVTATLHNSSGEEVAEVDLYKNHDGFYTGQWKFRIPGEAPDPNGTYTVSVFTPCTDETLEADFTVLQGEAYLNDSTAPSDVWIEASQPGRGSRFVGTSNGTFSVDPGIAVNLEALARDPVPTISAWVVVSDESRGTRSCSPHQNRR